jgi:predicted DsbA family dithiol-disulfide isomerase
MATIRITHFSDMLCVWAYIGQVRIAELQANFSSEVAFGFRYFNVFGDVQAKLGTQWRDRGGSAGYAEHVHEVASQFDHVNLCSDVWCRNIPTSSLPAHLCVAAARVLDTERGSSAAPAFDSAIRAAFFEAATDVSCMSELFAIAGCQDIEIADLQRKLENGQAHARVMSDAKSAEAMGVRSSPTMTFNEGRQTLSGNVGYRVLEANIRELIRRPAEQQSWC